MTRQRLAVFEVLAALGSHHGVDEIGAWLRDRGQPLPATSIYNAVETLEAAGLICVAHRGPPRALYEVAGRRHDHFVCRVCGDVIDADTTPWRRPRSALRGAVVESVQTTFRGVCAGCVAG